MDQERAPEKAHEETSLSAAESAAAAALARRFASDDPELARRLDTLGGYETSPLGLPSRWTAVPAALVAALIAIGALFGMTVSADETPVPGTMNSLHLK
ncbi:hypothetical protein EDD29_1684 [Actinocorallia herbida]|uniref:DUF3040 family protein n=1 Tax=Actinocorallia herbida TaxID=58109 RepID=A0A3N1CS97_9ACTN|nr:hypothetical protein [Actinocorallia herbida]ROO84167.1 hypothetical protein EDD29_1684 [Actinocorallia herbida]